MFYCLIVFPWKQKLEINTQLLFSTVHDIKTIVEPWILELFAGKPFPQSSVNHNDVNIVENSKLNVAISFQSLFFGRRID